jgi:hypothetical protein
MTESLRGIPALRISNALVSGIAAGFFVRSALLVATAPHSVVTFGLVGLWQLIASLLVGIMATSVVWFAWQKPKAWLFASICVLGALSLFMHQILFAVGLMQEHFPGLWVK